MSIYKTGMNAFDDVSLSMDCSTVSGLLVTYLKAEDEEHLESCLKKLITNKENFNDFLYFSHLTQRESFYFFGKMFPKMFNAKVCTYIRKNII